MAASRWAASTAIAAINERKAAKLYAEIDRTGFYRGTAQKESRSLMNVTFRLPSEELEKTFVKEATAAGLDGLKGHRSVGGMRASIYNAFPRGRRRRARAVHAGVRTEERVATPQVGPRRRSDGPGAVIRRRAAPRAGGGAVGGLRFARHRRCPPPR